MSRFLVRSEGVSAARIPPGNLLLITSASVVGPVQISCITHYSDEGFQDPIPRRLIVEVEGESDCTLDEAINAFGNAANSQLSMISVCANAPIDDLDVVLAYDITPNHSEHEFFQNFFPQEFGPPRHGRDIRLDATVAFIERVTTSRHQERLLRAIAQYRLAVGHWRRGMETFAVAHLWMAVEALTVAARRHAIAAEGCADENGLAARWGIEKKHLDRDVRRRLIFHGDNSCATKTREASDGFEHGFLDFEEVNRHSCAVRDKAAAHIRQAIIELAGLEDKPGRALLAPPYDEVRASWPLAHYIRGKFTGELMNCPNLEIPTRISNGSRDSLHISATRTAGQMPILRTT